MKKHRKNIQNLIELLAAAKNLRQVAAACDAVRADCSVLWAVTEGRDRRISRLALCMFRRIPSEGMLPRNTLVAKLLVLRQIAGLPVV